MILDSFLIFGVLAAISAFMNLVAPRRTGYGSITLILGSHRLCSCISCTTSSSVYGWHKDRSERPLLKSMPILVGYVPFWVIVLSFTPYFHKSSTQLFQMFLPSFLGSSLALVLRFYLKKRFNIKVRAQHSYWRYSTDEVFNCFCFLLYFPVHENRGLSHHCFYKNCKAKGWSFEPKPQIHLGYSPVWLQSFELGHNLSKLQPLKWQSLIVARLFFRLF